MNSAHSAVNALIRDLEKVLFALAMSHQDDVRNRIKEDAWVKMSTTIVASYKDHMPKELISLHDEIDQRLSNNDFDPKAVINSIITLFMKAVKEETCLSQA